METNNQVQFIEITVWGEDWKTDTELTITDKKPVQYWLSLPKSIQTELLDRLALKLEETYPNSVFIDTGYEIRLPKDYEPVEPVREFDKRLTRLYDSNKNVSFDF